MHALAIVGAWAVRALAIAGARAVHALATGEGQAGRVVEASRAPQQDQQVLNYWLEGLHWHSIQEPHALKWDHQMTPEWGGRPRQPPRLVRKAGQVGQRREWQAWPHQSQVDWTHLPPMPVPPQAGVEVGS